MYTAFSYHMLDIAIQKNEYENVYVSLKFFELL